MADLAKPRVAQSPAPSEPVAKGDPQVTVGQKQDIENYATYSLDHDVPFLADYYGLENVINYKDSPYKAEIDQIDDFLMTEVKEKRLENSTEAVKKRLAQLEKIAGIQKHIPTSQKIKTLAKYAQYLQELSEINQPVVL